MGFWLWARRNGRSIPAAGCDARDNEVQSQKTCRSSRYSDSSRRPTLPFHRDRIHRSRNHRPTFGPCVPPKTAPLRIIRRALKPWLNFPGNRSPALQFYAWYLGWESTMSMTFAERRMAVKEPALGDGKFLHTRTLGDDIVRMGGDGLSQDDIASPSRSVLDCGNPLPLVPFLGVIRPPALPPHHGPLPSDPSPKPNPLRATPLLENTAPAVPLERPVYRLFPQNDSKPHPGRHGIQPPIREAHRIVTWAIVTKRPPLPQLKHR